MSDHLDDNAPPVAVLPPSGPAPIHDPGGLASRALDPKPTIRVRHLWHRFGSFDVLRDVTFDVGPGEIFGFIGPNGAGKTTTIRVMATLLEPMAGRVEIDGIDVTIDPEAVRRSIGYMPDHAGVYDRITVREYLEFFADAFRVPSPGVVDAVLELTDLGKIQDRVVATMSKGMKQRLQLGRILLHDPKVLILDEPASDLDPRARIEIRDLLLELRGLGKTIFLSSHILTELSDVCTSIGILERGRLVVAGPIGEIAARLEQIRSAQAVGQAPPQYNQPRTRSAPHHQRHHHAPYPAGPPVPMGAPPGRPGSPPQQQGAFSQQQGAFPQQQPPGAFPQQQGAFPQPQPQPQAAHPQQQQATYPPVPGGYPSPQGAPAPEAGAGNWAPVQGAPPRSRVKIRVLGNPESAAYLVRGGPGIVEVQVLGAILHVGYSGNDMKIAEIVQHLVRNGVGVTGVEPERNELERIFLEVTRGEVQ